MRSCLDRFGNLVWSMALKQLPRSDAEEVVQDIFMELWRTADRFDPEKGRPVTFLAVLARRRILDRRRKLVRRPELADMETTPDPISESARIPLDTFSYQLPESLHVAFQSLSEDQRQAIEWVVGMGYTQEEAARALELPSGTLKSHLRRGLLRLREILQNHPIPSKS